MSRVPRPPRATRRSASSGAAAPSRSSSRPRRPKAATPAACVATAPTPASAHGTTSPTEKYFDWTAHADLTGGRSAATIEKVALWRARTAAPYSGASLGHVDAIVVDGLEKTYGKGVRALDGIRFAVSEGEVFGLLGPNGAGKSTTVRILVTLTKPDGGPRDRRRPRRRPRGRGASAARSATCRSTRASTRRDRAREPHPAGTGAGDRAGADSAPAGRRLLERFGLGEKANALVRTYSGGQKRRLDVAPASSTGRGPLPRRADDRPRPRGPRGDVGRARAPGAATRC